MNFNRRLSTEQEREGLIEYLVEDDWEGILRYPYSPHGSQARSMGKSDYRKKSYDYWSKVLGDIIIAIEFEKVDLKVFTTQFVYYDTDVNDGDENSEITIFSQKYMCLEGIYSVLTDDECYFDLNDPEELKLSRATPKGGRPQRPSDKNVLLAHKVLDLINHHNINLTDACKKIGIARSSYYRAAKWITLNVPFYSNTKIS